MKMRKQRRGAALYLTVLSNTLLVGLLGLAALTIVRIERRNSDSNSDMVKAQLASHAAIELTIYDIQNDASWRTNYTNNVESTAQAFGDGTLRWKLVDADADLSDDANDSVDVYGIGQVGTAIWVERCTLTPEAGPPQPNILTNADCENGTTDWQINGSASLASSTVDPHGGAACVHAFNRWSSFEIPWQEFATSSIQNGTAYDVTVWVKVNSTQNVTPQFYIQSSGSGWQAIGSTSTHCPAGVWTEVTATITPTWSGSLTYASIMWTTQTAVDFWFDDATLVEKVSGPGMEYVAGSRQRVAYP